MWTACFYSSKTSIKSKGRGGKAKGDKKTKRKECHKARNPAHSLKTLFRSAGISFLSLPTRHACNPIEQTNQIHQHTNLAVCCNQAPTGFGAYLSSVSVIATLTASSGLAVCFREVGPDRPDEPLICESCVALFMISACAGADEAMAEEEGGVGD
eukprot:m.91354 g.91354  ORF g.91354 m.91354 type:complete len:155 (+) comp12944_c0_seq3:427-891(+)